MTQRVTAVIDGRTADLQDAVRSQTREPDAIVTTTGLLDTAHGAAQDAPWLWVLDGTAVPRTDALERLLGVPPASAAVVLASAVLDGRDGVATGLGAWFHRDAAGRAVEASAAGLLPIRAARTASLLLDGPSARRAGPPSRTLGPAAAALAWTGAMLRTAPGFLVADSVAVAAGPAPVHGAPEALDDDPARDAGACVALLFEPAFGPRDRWRIAIDGAGRMRAARRSGALARRDVARAGLAGVRLGLSRR